MTPQGLSLTSQTNELGELFFSATRMCLGQAPTELFGLSQDLPTVLYFPADRRVVAPAVFLLYAAPHRQKYSLIHNCKRRCYTFHT